MIKSDEDIGEDELKEAGRRLRHLEDVCLKEDGTVPPWLFAARLAVAQQVLEEVDD